MTTATMNAKTKPAVSLGEACGHSLSRFRLLMHEFVESRDYAVLERARALQEEIRTSLPEWVYVQTVRIVDQLT